MRKCKRYFKGRGLKAEVYTYESTVISNRKKNPAWELRDGAVYFANDVEGSMQKCRTCVLEGIEGIEN